MNHCWHTKRGARGVGGGSFQVVCCYCGTEDMATTSEIRVPGHGPFATAPAYSYPGGECLSRPHDYDRSHPDDCECKKRILQMSRPIKLEKGT